MHAAGYQLDLLAVGTTALLLLLIMRSTAAFDDSNKGRRADAALERRRRCCGRRSAGPGEMINLAAAAASSSSSCCNAWGAAAAAAPRAGAAARLQGASRARGLLHRPPAGLQALNMLLIAFTIVVAFLRPSTANFSPFVPHEYAASGGGGAAIITGAATIFFIFAGACPCPPSPPAHAGARGGCAPLQPPHLQSAGPCLPAWAHDRCGRTECDLRSNDLIWWIGAGYDEIAMGGEEVGSVQRTSRRACPAGPLRALAGPAGSMAQPAMHRGPPGRSLQPNAAASPPPAAGPAGPSPCCPPALLAAGHGRVGAGHRHARLSGPRHPGVPADGGGPGAQHPLHRAQGLARQLRRPGRLRRGPEVQGPGLGAVPGGRWWAARHQRPVLRAAAPQGRTPNGPCCLAARLLASELACLSRRRGGGWLHVLRPGPLLPGQAAAGVRARAHAAACLCQGAQAHGRAAAGHAGRRRRHRWALLASCARRDAPWGHHMPATDADPAARPALTRRLPACLPACLPRRSHHCAGDFL
jgi:hypothetical protein